MLEPQFTCAAQTIAETVPSLDSDPLGGMLPPKGWPAKGAKWLFYGPSYMNQAFQAVVAGASFVSDITSVEDAGEPYAQTVPDCLGSAAANATHKAFQLRADEYHRQRNCNSNPNPKPNPNPNPDPDPNLNPNRQLKCNWEKAHDTACHGAPMASAWSTRVTFANGAEMWGLNNAPMFQWESRADTMAALEDLLSKHDFDLIFYMAPHGSLYFQV